VSLDIDEGEFISIIGPSGSGKSTLMHILGCLDSPTHGTIQLDGTMIQNASPRELAGIRNRKIGFVFQFFNLLPMLTAEENITLPLSISGENPEAGWVEQVIGDVGLTDRVTHRPSELSGGQQQRVALARGLVSRPTVLFADEPTGNLDSATGGEILQLLRASVDTMGQTMVMVTHEPRAASIADRILFLADGLIVREMHGASDAHDVVVAMEEIGA
jgi:putative ABC transport system ATP-binding protein